jgi:hypothetical protein
VTLDPDKKTLLRPFFGFFLIYLLFMNPALDSSMTLNNLYPAIFLVDHRSVALSTYRGTDVAFHDGSLTFGVWHFCFREFPTYFSQKDGMCLGCRRRNTTFDGFCGLRN